MFRNTKRNAPVKSWRAYHSYLGGHSFLYSERHFSILGDVPSYPGNQTQIEIKTLKLELSYLFICTIYT